jgi:hypothetical protein
LNSLPVPTAFARSLLLFWVCCPSRGDCAMRRPPRRNAFQLSTSAGNWVLRVFELFLFRRPLAMATSSASYRVGSPDLKSKSRWRESPSTVRISGVLVGSGGRPVGSRRGFSYPPGHSGTRRPRRQVSRTTASPINSFDTQASSSSRMLWMQESSSSSLCRLPVSLYRNPFVVVAGQAIAPGKCGAGAQR